MCKIFCMYIQISIIVIQKHLPFFKSCFINNSFIWVEYREVSYYVYCFDVMFYCGKMIWWFWIKNRIKNDVVAFVCMLWSIACYPSSGGTTTLLIMSLLLLANWAAMLLLQESQWPDCATSFLDPERGVTFFPSGRPQILRNLFIYFW